MKTKKTSKALKKSVKKPGLKRVQRGGIGRGTIFIVVIMITLMFTAYIFVGGTIPETIPAPRTDGIVSVNKYQKKYPQELGLQMHTFEGATITPYPTLGPAVAEPESLPVTELNCTDAIVGTPLPDLIWGYRIASSKASGDQQSLQVFFSGAEPVAVGVTAQTTKPAQRLLSPSIGGAKDPNGYPISAAVFLTDITNNPADVSGDAKNGGVAQFPSDVYGAWQTEAGVKTDVPNGQYLGTDADLWPPANGPGGGARRSEWTAELIWKTSVLRTKDGVGLSPGKTYRMQIIVHSGTKNEKIGMACTSFSL